MKRNLIFFLFVSILLSSGCVSYNSLLNYNESQALLNSPQVIANFQPLMIQNNDILHIDISGSDPVALDPFSTDQGGAPGGANSPQNLLLNGYLVDSKGDIDLPTLGKVKLVDLTLEQAKEKIEQLLDPYFEELPLVKVRLLNFRINVNGEVTRPGIFNIENQSVTILEALSLAGDLTDYSSRDSILIIREEKGQRSFGYINLNSADAFNSPYFYLQQNDVVYVRPAKTKLAVVRDPATRIFTWISAITGVAAFVITLSRL